MKRRWSIKPHVPPDFQKKFPALQPVILQLLHNRGIDSAEAWQAFLKPRFESLSSPFALTDMAAAVERLLLAVASSEKITIYADYDADAVTACAVLYRALNALGAQVTTYIPDRFSEGYGLNEQAVKDIAAGGTKLIVTVDCGINAIAEAATASDLGVGVIITDHHEIVSDLPKALAVVNPKRDPHLAGLQGLTGVGVAFKLVSALFSAIYSDDYQALYGWGVPEGLKAQGTGARARARVGAQWEKWLLDLVAIGTVADCQSLLGENRVLVKYGLQVLPKTKWPGLRQLLRNSGLESRESFDTFDLGFILAPRINAAGRIQHADIAFRLLSTEDPAEAVMYAGQLESLNAHRQRLTEQVVNEAREQVLAQGGNKILLAAGDNWPKGVVGLVAARLSEEFSRPAVVLERGVDLATGSARSVGEFNLVRAFSASSDYLQRFGGHAAAAGVTLKNEHIHLLHRSLLDFAEVHLKTEDMVKQLEIDAVLEAADLTDSLVEEISGFAPFGPGNPSVNFLFSELVVERLQTVGATSKHLKLHLSSKGKILEFIGFNHAPRHAHLKPGDRLDIVAEPSHNHWNGRRKIQLKVLDILKKDL